LLLLVLVAACAGNFKTLEQSKAEKALRKGKGKGKEGEWDFSRDTDSDSDSDSDSECSNESTHESRGRLVSRSEQA
jgi:hypothetical protein